MYQQMYMKKVFTILLLSILGLWTFGQELDRTFYLLGSLEDYMGRHYPKNNPKQWGYILILHQQRIGEIKRIEEITGSKFSRMKKRKDCRNCHEFFILKSFCLAREINSFYNFTKMKEWKDLLGFAFFNGQLECDKVLNATHKHQISFLAGQFLTAGEKTEKGYRLSLYNSPKRYECLIKLLESLNCKINTKEVKKGIPVSFVIEFEPTDEIIKILDNEILKEQTLTNSQPDILTEN